MSLTKAGNWLLYYDDFTQWLKYVDGLRAKNPAKETSAISRLTAYFGDATLYKMIDEGTKTSRTKGLATELQIEQMKLWVSVAKNPDDVFHFMELDKVKKDILSNPEFSAWAKYVDDFNAKYPEKQASMIPTLLKSYNDATLFRMSETAMSVEGTKSIATKLQDQLIRVWLNSRKSPDEALEKLGLGMARNSLLEHPFFSSWLKYTNAYSTKYPQEESTVIKTLTRRFGDTNVVRILGAAVSKDATRSIATKLESAQLEMWFRNGKSVDDVREWLRIDDIGDFTGIPLLNTWVSYLNVVLKENPGKATELLTKLETHFTDKPFNQILQAAMKFPSMESAATKIQAEKIKGYLASNQNPVQVFKWLDLDNVGNGLFSDPLFTKWMKYAKDFKKKNSKYQESWFTPIHMHYNDYEGMIERAKNNPSTTKLAKLLEREQSKYWLDEKHLPQHVFEFLTLDSAYKKTLASPTFKTWAKYLNDFNRRYPKDKTTMIDGLRANYNDRELLEIFNTAKKESNTEKLAMNLESALVNKWVAEKKPLADLKTDFDHLGFADGLLERYAEKVKALSGTAS
ncbi:putative RxLR effector [Phytophthora cinnamomi]|uniref:putative RxLR effector n=1 Tax=Phytophthora cinnamomi TaxID=4785 RepID=UPI00355AC7E6|nr:putative RxLR effector [Phytophthora cinnamomi]